MSELPLEADMLADPQHVGFVPDSEVELRVLKTEHIRQARDQGVTHES